MSSPAERKNAESSSTYADELLDHDYDGIQEYDNPMPGWWTWLFIATIVWSVLYVVGIGLGYVNSYEDDLASGQAELQVMRDQHQSESPDVDASALAAAAEDSDKLATGEQIYAKNCVACHGEQGEGLIGPNLTDAYWKSGGAPAAIYTAIKDGIPANGMPPWEPSLSADELVAVTAFVMSIQGTDPPGAKEAEGELYEGN